MADRRGVTHRFKIGEERGYVTVNLFPDGSVGEIFVKMAKMGTAISGLLDALSISVSLGLQHGVPLEIYCQKFSRTQFEPDGFTGPEFKFASSVIDYIFRWLEARYVKGKP